MQLNFSASWKKVLWISMNFLLISGKHFWRVVKGTRRQYECMHTGSFAQNSFQITVNSFNTSKKLQFWLKFAKIIHFLMLKTIMENLGFILEMIKNCQVAPQVQYFYNKCKNHDIVTINLPLGMAWVSKAVNLSSSNWFGLLFFSQNCTNPVFW